VAFHLIEQFTGATFSLLQLGNLSNMLNRTMILPGVDQNTTDGTIYNSFDALTVRDLDLYLNIEKIERSDANE
jgi:hypothetical protein